MWQKPSKLNCGHCKSHCRNKCDSCENAYYCNEKHQKLHWNTHKSACESMLKVKIKKCVNECGTNRRTLVAKNGMTSGNTILRENTMIRGPDENLSSPEEILIEGKPSSCIVCSKMMGKGNLDKMLKMRLCPDCFWPVCSSECEECHGLTECEFFKGSPYPPKTLFTPYMPAWKFIMIIRALMYKRYSKEGFRKLMELDVNPIVDDYPKILAANKLLPDDIPVPEAIKTEQNVICDAMRLMKHYKMNSFLDQDKLIKHTIQLLEWNCVQLGDEYSAFNGVYKLLSAATQSCMPNAIMLITPENQAVLVATRDIKVGDEIKISKDYWNILLDNYQRKVDLFHRFTNCSCPRCIDPTELGTYYSAIKCCNFKRDPRIPGCGSGYLLPHPICFDNQVVWKCDKCTIERSDAVVSPFLDKLVKDAHLLRKTEVSFTTRILKNNLSSSSLLEFNGGDKILEFVKKLEKRFLHPNNHLICDLKYGFIQLLSDGIHKIFSLDQQENYQPHIAEASKLILENVDFLWKISQIVHPGISMSKANLIYYKQQAFALLLPEFLKTGKSEDEKASFRKKLEETRNQRELARSIFQFYLESKIHSKTVADKLNWMAKDGLIYRYFHRKFPYVTRGGSPKNKVNLYERPEDLDGERSDSDEM